MFEVKDGWLCLTGGYKPGRPSYEVELSVEDEGTGKVFTQLLSVRTLGESQSRSQIYPDFSLSEKAELAESGSAIPDDPVPETGAPSGINWPLIGMVFALCAAC